MLYSVLSDRLTYYVFRGLRRGNGNMSSRFEHQTAVAPQTAPSSIGIGSSSHADQNTGMHAMHQEQQNGCRWLSLVWPQTPTMQPATEATYRDQRARFWWRRDVAGYAVLCIVSFMYVLATCYLDAQAAVGSSNRQAAVPQQALCSGFLDAPTAETYSKLVLAPPYSMAVTPATAVAALLPTVGPAGQTCGTAPPGLRQLLYRRAAAATASLVEGSSSSSRGWFGSLVLRVLQQPKQLMQQVLLLYVWRVWFMADLLLLVKVATGMMALTIALINPGAYCHPRMRTALVVTYLTAPVLLLPIRLLTCRHIQPSPSSLEDITTLIPSDPFASPAPFLSWPWSFFQQCPVSSVAQGYRVMMSYASVVVLATSVLHPLPLAWQAAVNACTWLSLVGSGVIIRMRYAPALAAAAYGSVAAGVAGSSAAADSAVRQAVAGGLGMVEVGSRQDRLLLLLEVLATCLDAVLLSGLLPLMIATWADVRARQKFLLSQRTEATSTPSMGQPRAAPVDTASMAKQAGIKEIEEEVQPAAAAAVPSPATAANIISSAASSSSSISRLVTAAAGVESPPRQPGSSAAQRGARSSIRIAGARTSSESSGASASGFEPLTPLSAVEPGDDNTRSVRFSLPEAAGDAAGATSSAAAGPAAAYTAMAMPTAAAEASAPAVARPGSSSSTSGTAHSAGGQTSPRQQPGQQPLSLQLSPITPGRAVAVPGAFQGLPPRRARSTLYTSPLETVIVSFKFASPGELHRAAAAATGPSAAAAPAAGQEGPAAVGAAASSSGGSGAGGGAPAPAAQEPQWISHPAVSRQLRSDIEAAVRGVAAQSQLQLLTASVSTFPGCVHVVMSLSLCTAAALMQAAGAITAGANPAASAGEAPAQQLTTSAAAGSQASAGRVNWVQVIDWGKVVQQLQHCSYREEGGDAAGEGGGEGLQLRYMLAQDGTGQDQWFWQAAAAAGADSNTIPAGAETSGGGDTAQQAGAPGGIAAAEVPEEGMAAAAAVAAAQGPLAAIAGVITGGGSARSSSSSGQRNTVEDAMMLLTNGLSVKLPAGNRSGSSSSSSSGSSWGDRCVPFTALPTAEAPSTAASLAAALHSRAQGITLSCFTLPCDFRLADLLSGPLSGPVLRIPDSLTSGLAAQGAGLRVVITPAAAAAAAAAARGRASSGPEAGEAGALSTNQGKPLVDVTYWPGSRSSNNSGSSRWPAFGEFPLLQLLPAGTDGALLACSCGPVLAVNLLVTPAAPTVSTEATAGKVGSSSSSRGEPLTECLLLQLPLLLVPSVVCEGLQQLEASMVAEAGSYEAAYKHSLLPLVRDIAALLLGPKAAVPAPVAPAAAAGDSSKVNNQHLAQQLQLLQEHSQQLVYEHLAARVLQFMADQGAAACAAALQQLLDPQVRLAAVPAPTAYADFTPAAPPQPSAAADTAAAVDATATPEEACSSAAGTVTEEKSAAAAAVEQAEVAKAMKQAAAAQADAQAAKHTAAQASAALAAAMQGLNALSASATAAVQQAQRAESAAASAVRRAAAAATHSQRQRALYLIGGGQVESGPLGSSIWGLLGAASGLRSGAEAEVLLEGPPQLREHVSHREVMLGFRDERLEVQYRRLKAMQICCLDRAAFLMQVLREATIMWKVGRALQAVPGSGLSLVLMCKYEAVTVLPYLVSLLCPDFWIQHRNFTLMLSQVACALTVGMITATEVYRSEWSQLLASKAGQQQQVLARPAMLLAWFYLIVPLMQQLCVPDQLVSCIAQAAQSFLVYRYIFRGTLPLPWLLVCLVAGGCVSLCVAYAGDGYMRCQAVAAARRTGVRAPGQQQE